MFSLLSTGLLLFLFIFYLSLSTPRSLSLSRLYQDRANTEYASLACVTGLASLLTPLLLGNEDRNSNSAKVGTISGSSSMKKNKSTKGKDHTEVTEEVDPVLKKEVGGWRKKHVLGSNSLPTQKVSIS
jgi:hypothetical protein